MTQKRLPKIKPNSARWIGLANAVRRDFAPRIYPCAKCSYPVADGYCCTFCCDSNPSEAADDAQ